MKKMRVFGMAAACTAIAAGVLWLCFGEKIKILHTSLKSFKDENLAYTFQHTPEIQPTKKISRGDDPFQFLKEENVSLADGFRFKGGFYPTEGFLEDTKTSALLVVKDDVIKYEKYFYGGDPQTLFSSNSMGKSFVSALMGIAVAEGAVESVEDPIGKYVPEFAGTDLESIPIRACLQMASGIDFNEDTDMSRFSMRTLMGTPSMKVIAEACVLLTQKRNEKDYEFEIEVSLMIDSDRLFEDSRPTYTNIRKYVFDKYGIKLQLKDIADVKRDYGMKMKVNKHLIKGDEPVRRKCTPNKRKYIIEALKYYHAI